MLRILPLLALYLVGATVIAMSSGAADCGQHWIFAPTRPIGPDSTWLGNTETYRTISNTPGGSNLRYIFDWSDGSDDTTDLYPSGDTASATKTWTSVGVFTVKALAEDTSGHLSITWSDGLSVHVYPDTD
jgi:hypothetical protein